MKISISRKLQETRKAVNTGLESRTRAQALQGK